MLLLSLTVHGEYPPRFKYYNLLPIKFASVFKVLHNFRMCMKKTYI